MHLHLLWLGALASASTLTPPVLPLIVRNPYLSTWLGNARNAPWEDWPMFWTGAHIGFSVMASVPDTGTVYPLLGQAHGSLRGSHPVYNVSYPDYLGATFDASTTNLTYSFKNPSPSDDEPLKLTLSFLSPITPSSTLRQSIPAAYLTVFVEGTFDVNVYVDVNGEWVSGNRGNQIRWELTQSDPSAASVPIKTFKVRRSFEQLLTEFADRSEWGTLHFSAPTDVSHQCGTSAVLRQQFAEAGSLKNHVDSNFRSIMDEEPVFAYSKSFKLAGERASASSKPADQVVFTFALVQDPVVQYASARGLTLMKPLWAAYFRSADELVRYHYSDYDVASALARSYADSLGTDAFKSGSHDYRDIAALSARQVLGATQFSGTPDNPILFLKEISSNGNFQTVDVIFPAFPFFLYTNPKWLAYLLEPLLEHQLSGQYPNDYSMHDLGAHFPNATGHPDGRDEYMPVEECGNMLIMGLALANALKDDTAPVFSAAGVETLARSIPGAKQWSSCVDRFGIDSTESDASESSRGRAAERWASRSYKLWKQWTGYLVRESLIPHNQLSTDDFAGWLANQTNLALKGIIGIKAMSEISELVGEGKDAAHYRDVADHYIEKWQEYGISRDHTHAKLAYTWYGSWTTIYNLYADSLLCFHIPTAEKSSGTLPKGSNKSGQKPIGGGRPEAKTFIPDEVYKMQSDWYHAVLQRYGLPLDSRHLYAKSDWEFFAAAVTSRKTRTEILNSIALWVNETSTDRPLTDLYDTEGTGGFPGPNFMARPVVGGHFAFLALERACGGKAIEALKFLDKEGPVEIDVEEALLADETEGERRIPMKQPWVDDL
ncbi:hypothetical protein VTK73DRAFT_4583 [Phialemonium thermophilum]|uniref:Glutaminase n=1 Tax=Phialemonium thermophilum TaxID=223376 RepID=A0ABR3XYQ1_9PEZI